MIQYREMTETDARLLRQIDRSEHIAGKGSAVQSSSNCGRKRSEEGRRRSIYHQRKPARRYPSIAAAERSLLPSQMRSC